MRPSLLTAPVLLVAAFLAFAPPALGQLTDAERKFRASFEASMKIGAKDEMKRLVDKETDFAVNWIIQTAEAISASPNDVLFDRIAALRSAWRASKETDFCDKMERYFSLMDPAIKRERIRMRGEYDDAVRAYWANSEKKDGSTYFKLGGELTALGEAFAEIEDWYYCSQAWMLVGHCFDEPLRGSKDADMKQACKAFQNSLEAREKIGLKDRLYIELKPRIVQLVALGYGSETGEGGEAGAPAAGPRVTGASLSVPLAFELIEEVDAIQRPSWYLDELYPSWNSISLGSKGSQVPFPRLEQGPSVMRLGSAKVAIDVDRDGSGEGEADVEIRMRGRLEPFVFETGDGPSRRKVAFLAVTGVEKDSYHSIEVNLAPTDDNITIYMTGAGSMVGEVDGTRLQIIDDDLNGVYGSAPSAWGQVGMTKDSYQPEIDSMVIGDGKRALPFSEYAKIGDKWYQLEVMNAGTSLVAHPCELKTGKIALKYKGLKPDFLLIKGSNLYENCYFDLAADKEIEIPTGRYFLYYGMVSKGKKKQLMKAVVVPGAGNQHWDILGEDTVEVELGGPFGFDFTATIDDSTVLVHGDSVCVVGKAGERYERIWGAVPRPEVSVRKAGSKRGSKGEDMPAVLDQDSIYTEGWAVAWFPRDLELRNHAGAEAQVQLIEKKNKLFGKIESVWK